MLAGYAAGLPKHRPLHQPIDCLPNQRPHPHTSPTCLSVRGIFSSLPTHRPHTGQMALTSTRRAAGGGGSGESTTR